MSGPVKSVRPFLMFQGGTCEEAITFYTSVLPAGRINDIRRYGPGEAGPEGSVFRATFEVAGQQVVCIDSPVKHVFDFTPSFSFFVECGAKEELTRLAEALSEGGMFLMPTDNYGFSRKFCWLQDRFGISWQLNFE
ncbi:MULTISPECIES: VOC family protein [unclassified Neorhizobium]|uniref:VOC family protein n=1 Tax=unclassified Neorhizobium TaxID=2629175 RepID=UPI001FF39A3E|nr:MULTISPECIES: VOC family protein [unclassified Neorhizobium]MCJ9672083.1 VOC family protein [Neorhizobium sp. SHOUNA12B]MCJ9744504.1 VOC family protein [Neorhizobium sp. SHOUNA12A]